MKRVVKLQTIMIVIKQDTKQDWYADTTVAVDAKGTQPYYGFST